MTEQIDCSNLFVSIHDREIDYVENQSYQNDFEEAIRKNQHILIYGPSDIEGSAPVIADDDSAWNDYSALNRLRDEHGRTNGIAIEIGRMGTLKYINIIRENEHACPQQLQAFREYAANFNRLMIRHILELR